jgi:hypothetical protein
VRDAGATYITVVAHELLWRFWLAVVRDREMRERAGDSIEDEHYWMVWAVEVCDRMELRLRLWRCSAESDDHWVQLRQIVKNRFQFRCAAPGRQAD